MTVAPDAGAPSPSGPALPGGAARPTRQDVAASQRARLLHAVTRCVADKGYAATTLADIVEAAGVSRTTFYQHFGSKGDCLVAAYRTGFAQLRVEMRRAADLQEPWLPRLRASLATLLSALAQAPEFSRAFFVELPAAGEDAQELRDEIRGVFTAAFRGMSSRAAAQDEELDELPEHLVHTIVGGIGELIAVHVREGRLEQLPLLEPDITHFVVAVMLGASGAKQLMQEQEQNLTG